MYDNMKTFLGFIWNEIKQLYNEGLIEYLHDW